MCSSRATTPWLSPTLRLMFCAAGKHRACWIFAAAAAVSAPPSRTSCRMPTLADISRPALAVAKRNTKRLKLMNRVTAVGLDARKRGPSFVGTLDALVCNPPYVTSEEMTRLEPSVKEYEPALALDGGKDGLAFYRAVAENFTHLLADGGYLCFEFGLGQHMAVSMILQEYGYTDIVLRKDLRGVVRAVRGKKK